MPSKFIQALLTNNLVSYYLLPLIHLNRISFGEGNFLESYVDTAGKTLTIEVLDVNLVTWDKFRKHYLYLGSAEYLTVTQEQHDLVYYRLPPKWQSDFRLFVQGRYSQLSPEAKRLIREYSGLLTEESYADARIYALDRDPRLARHWEEELGLPHRWLDSQELLPVPPERNYFEVQTTITP